MKNMRTFVILVIGILSTVLAQPSVAEEPLRSVLEKTWKAYLEAGKSGKESELQKTMSSFRFGTMKNNLASAGRSLTPNMIKSIAEDAPDISEAKFANLLENGPTAALIYVKDSEEKDATGAPRIEFVFIKFVKESSGWKVDAGMNIGSPKYQADGKESSFEVTDLPPTYEIDGQVRKAPEPCAASEIAGLLDLFSYGYDTQVTINGVEQDGAINKSRSGLVKGGLRKGENTVVIVFKRVEKDAATKPTVTIRRVLKDRTTAEAFKCELKENIEGKHSYTFTLDE